MNAMKAHAAPVLGAENVAESVQWYCDNLHFTCPEGIFMAGDNIPVYAVLKRDDIEIHIQIRRRKPHPAPREPVESDAYFFTADTKSLYKHCKSQDIKIIRPIADSQYGLTDFCIEDLVGNRLNFGWESEHLT
jgi:hypothetical protein